MSTTCSLINLSAPSCISEMSAGTAKPDRPAPPVPVPSPTLSSQTPTQTLKPPFNKLQRPSRTSSPKSHVYAHQVHPNQPSPSPSQLNNPAIYTSPPPGRPGRPTSSQGSFQFPEPRIPGGTSPSPNFYAGQTPSFPPTNWSGPPPPPPPQILQPQPVNATQGLASPSSKPFKPSTVVHGLMDKLLTRH